MTADMLALLAAILRDPADDGLRLAYADACRDAGQVERAEFVTVQLELATIPDPSPTRKWDDPLYSCGSRWGELRRRERELIDDNPPWLYPIPTMRADKIIFRRGFVAEVRLTWQSWRDHGDAILAEHPVEVVRLTTRPGLVVCGTGAAPGSYMYAVSDSDDGPVPDERFWVMGPRDANFNYRDGIMQACFSTRWPADPARPRFVVSACARGQLLERLNGPPALRVEHLAQLLVVPLQRGMPDGSGVGRRPGEKTFVELPGLFVRRRTG